MDSICCSPDLSAAQLTEIKRAIAELPEIGSKIYDRKGQKVYRFEALDRTLVGKVYHITGAKRKIAAALNRSRGRRSYRSGLLLQNAGIPTPEPVVLIENHRFLPTESVLITGFCPGKSLRDYLDDQEPPPPDLPHQLLDILHRLDRIHYRHGDFHSHNILICENRPYLIDLDSARLLLDRRSSAPGVLRDRDRLLKSVEFVPEYHRVLAEVIGAKNTPLPKQ